MKPETRSYLAKARLCLSDAESVLSLRLGDVAAKEAYLAAFHSAEAWIFEHTGKVVKTHKGVRTEFARLAKDDSELARFTRFLARAYELKSVADYGIEEGRQVAVGEAQAAIQTASDLIAAIAAKLHER